jgi:hypothetical protein
MLAQFFRDVGVNRAGMALLFLDPERRQIVEHRLALDFQLSRQIVDPDLIH